jgi:hypothetical protein
METGDLVIFGDFIRDGIDWKAEYCSRIEKQIGEHRIGMILEANGKSYLVIFGINQIVLHGSFLKKV